MPLKLRTPMPDLSGATDWISGEPVHPEALAGHVTLVHFWAVSCGICKPHLPTLCDWARAYEGKGVRFVSIHMPRQESDTDVEAVRRTHEEHGIPHVTAVDNTHAITDLFQNEYVPAYYVFDRDGLLRLYMSGEKVLPQVRASIDRLLERKDEPVA